MCVIFFSPSACVASCLLHRTIEPFQNGVKVNLKTIELLPLGWLAGWMDGFEGKAPTDFHFSSFTFIIPYQWDSTLKRSPSCSVG